MPVPKRKTSKSRRDMRSSCKGAEVKAIISCQMCQAASLPHQVCVECGYYKGKKILRTKTDRMHQRGAVRKAYQEKMQQRQPEAPKEESKE